jgi:hypothetical protein
VIRRAAVRDSSATLLRSSRSFAPNLGTSRGQYVLLEELDCELGDLATASPVDPGSTADRCRSSMAPVRLPRWCGSLRTTYPRS